ncbi:hypothetical protein [Thomasclavelia cocleata]|uniref:hypothetical protein n=1 Tax=Thomasclavelia cocleata TaxID=69824 RepID=UPI00242DEA01|nr:hypothetical protein [Thomasclavelia cocleata]
MYNIIKDVLNKNEYKLEDMLYKINKLWVENRLTESESDELKRIATDNININNEYPDLQKQIKSLGETVENLINRVSILEGETLEPPTTVQEWQQWNGLPYGAGGIGIYAIGERVMRENTEYESMINDNVYDPLMVDERIWKNFDI